MNLNSQKRARSRLKPELLEEIDSFQTTRVTKRHQKKAGPPQLKILLPLMYLLIGGSLTAYVLFAVQPQSIRNIPVPDSYGPLLFSIALGVYGLLKFIIRSKILSLLLTFAVITLLSLKLQHFHDIL